MSLYLNERQIGYDPSTIGFPTIGSCMGLAVQDKDGMFGFHVMPGDGSMAAEFAKYIIDSVNYTGDMTRMYGCSRWAQRYGGGVGRTQWEAEMREIAETIDFRGEVCGFDASAGTKLNSPGESLYIEFRMQGDAQVSFHYKRTDKVTGDTDYTQKAHSVIREILPDTKATNQFAAENPGVLVEQQYQRSEKLRRGVVPHVALKKVTRGNKGDFHSVAKKNMVSFIV